MTSSTNHLSALVIGASGGIGAAVVEALEADARYGRVEGLSRRGDGLDLTDERRVADAAAAFDDAAFDLIFNATGVLAAADETPEKSFAAIDPETMARVFAVNTIGAALAFKHFAPLLARSERSAFATLSARVGSIGDNRLGGWMSYRASKAALNQLVRCAAVEIGRNRPDAVVVALHPGTIETPLTRRFARGRYTASADEAARDLLDVIDKLNPDQSGGFFDYAGDEIPW